MFFSFQKGRVMKTGKAWVDITLVNLLDVEGGVKLETFLLPY